MATQKLKDCLLLKWCASDDGAHQWVKLDAHRDPVGEVTTGTLDECAKSAGAMDVILLVPGSEVLLTSVDLPDVDSKKQHEMLPYALEDALIASPYEYHFSTAEHADSKLLNVACSSLEKMNTWVSACKRAGLRICAIYPSQLCVPFREGAVQVHLDDDGALVRTQRFNGFFSGCENLAKYFEAALVELADLKSVVVHDFRQKGQNPLSIESQYHHYPHEMSLKALSRHVCDKDNINLLSGDFAISKTSSLAKRFWLLTGVILLGTMAIEIGGLVIETHKLNNENSALKHQITSVYMQHFPNATEVVAPEYRLEKKLKAQAEAVGDQRYLTLLSRVGKIFWSYKRVTINSIRFKEEALSMVVSAESAKDVDVVVRRLKEDQFRVTEQRVENIEERVKVTLLIK